MASLGHNKLKLCHFKYLSVFWVCLPVTIQCLTILYRSYCVGEWVYRIVWLTGKDIHAPSSRLIVTPLVNRLCALRIMIFSLQYAIAFLLWNKLLFSPLRSIPADGFIAWRNFCLSFRLSNLANKSGVATLSVTKNCSMGAIYLTWQGCFRRFLISGAELSKYDFFLQNIAILNTFSSSVNW